jgi:integrase/recombinase XerD
MVCKTSSERDRLMLELMAREGMRVGEVLKLIMADVDGKKLRLIAPKSGRPQEHVYLPQKLATRLDTYIKSKGFAHQDRVFPMSYAGARSVVVRASDRLGLHVRPHDLRRFAATHASRFGVPLEIVSKVILRHSNPATTQIYLGKVSDEEAFELVDSLHS